MARRTRLTVATALCALGTAGLAAAAERATICHPDPRGTRSLTVNGDVTGYAFANGRVDVRWTRSRRCAGTASWNYAADAHATAPASCAAAVPSPGRSVGEKLVAAQGNRIVRVVLAPASVDRPDRLDVLDRASHRKVATWPLIDRPARVALYGGVAVLSAADRHALYALRLSDGRIAMLGIARAGDRPIIGPQGVVYQDDLDLAMRRAAPHSVTLKLLPTAVVRNELARTGRQIGTSRINAIAMDGKRVAFVVHDPAGNCDKVLFWSIQWHFVARLTERVGPTCLPAHAAGGITNVAIAGERAAWTTHYGTSTRVLAASIIDCVEWVVGRPTSNGRQVAGLSGDDNTLAFAVAGSAGASNVALVPSRWRASSIARSNSRVVAISADGGRVAALREDGTVAVVTRGGRPMHRIAVGHASALSLHMHTLAVLEQGTLDVYDVRSGRLLHTWRVPSNATSVDLQYGIAVLAAGRDVFAVNAASGRTARLLHAPGSVRAQIEEPGAAVQFNVGTRGYLRFIPMSVIEASTS
jgi:hypothetical protein